MIKITIKEILAKNLKIDKKQLEESIKLSEKLRSQGIVKRRYELVPPFAGKKVKAVDTEEERRTIHLTQP